MCGINGFTFKNPELIQKMNLVTHHRGPDETHIWCGDTISLGHNRLSIIDLSERAAQPMWDREKRYVIIFNGEVYNFTELRNALKQKYTFRSESDTEVILYAYREWGPGCLNKLNGIFALAIFDTHTKELFLARDQMGVKPLYYYLHNGQLIFSSEIKGILAHPIPRAVNQSATHFFFNLLYIPEPLTLFAGIHKLPAAHYAVFKKGQLHVERYWQVSDFTDRAVGSETVQDIKTLFDDAVRRQLVSDRPVGVFLSGGLDSTAVLGAAKKYTTGSVKTFSVGFAVPEDDAKFNADLRLARETAKIYETDHTEVCVSAHDVKENLAAIAHHLDEPNFNPTAAAIYLLSREAKKQVAVVLGGDGADELFGGYPRYYYSRLISAWQDLPRSIRGVGESGLGLLGKKELLHKLRLPASADRVLAFLAQSQKTVNSFLNTELTDRRLLREHFTERYFATEPPADFEKYFMNIDRQSWLVDESLLRSDKMTMAFGLEERVPILDRRLVELAYRIPTSAKLSLFKNTPTNFQGKAIWREAVREYLPEHLLHEKKRGWFTPMAKWLRGDLRDTVSEIIASSNLNEDFFNRNGVQELWQNHLSGKQYNLNSIWAVVMWQLWYAEFIEKP